MAKKVTMKEAKALAQKKALRLRAMMQKAWNELSEADDFVEGSEEIRELMERLDRVTDDVAEAIEDDYRQLSSMYKDYQVRGL